MKGYVTKENKDQTPKPAKVQSSDGTFTKKGG